MGVNENVAAEPDDFLINVLNRLQEEHGYIPADCVRELSQRLGIPESQIYGVITFFKALRTQPPGKHRINVCFGTACYARGAPLIYDRLVDELKLESGDTSPDGLVTVEKVYCIGACSQAPLMVVDGEIKGRLKSYQVPLILKELRDRHEHQPK